MPSVQIQREDWADPLVSLPSYTTVGAAGADIRANFPVDLRVEGQSLAPGARALIPTGIRIAIDAGYEVQVRPRSGLALKQGLTVANAPGTIDSDYRGPVGVILINLGHETVHISHGDRIAQLVVAAVASASFEEVGSLGETERGAGGFGSTGVS